MTTVVKKKICMVGAPHVGKTSLVRRFVDHMFGERYHSTIGVKIDEKTISLGDREVVLVLWDLAGADDGGGIPTSYLRGASGYLLVMDGTAPESIAAAGSLHAAVRSAAGLIPFLAIMNKADLAHLWRPGAGAAVDPAWPLRTTSARTGAGVEDAFRELAAMVVASSTRQSLGTAPDG